MPTADFTPTVEELGHFMRARTKTRYGATVGTFTDTTPVTEPQAEGLIAEAVDEIGIAVGPDLPEGPAGSEDIYKRSTKAAVLLLASMNVELQLVPDQVDDPRSPYAALERRYNNFRKALIEAVADARGDETQGEESVAVSDARLPSYGGFPEPGTTTWERY